MRSDIFEQCYQFNMKRNAIKREMLSAYERTCRKVAAHSWNQVHNDFYLFSKPGQFLDYVKFVFWNNHPYWAWLLHEEFNDPNFLDCAKTVRKIAYTYRDLPYYTGLINYDMYQVAPVYC